MSRSTPNSNLIYYSRLAALLLAAAIGLLSFAVFEGLAVPASCLLGWMMLAIAIEDARSFIIPDVLSLPAIPAGLLAAGVLSPADSAYETVLWHLAGAITAAVALYLVRWAYRQLRQVDGLGLGDVKLAAVAGAWTGLAGTSTVLLLACAAALTFVGIAALIGK
ncbi:MAG: prepilin peptidase, partial [Hyphomicrobiaceae bacterium]